MERIFFQKILCFCDLKLKCNNFQELFEHGRWQKPSEKNCVRICDRKIPKHTQTKILNKLNALYRAFDRKKKKNDSVCSPNKITYNCINLKIVFLDVKMIMNHQKFIVQIPSYSLALLFPFPPPPLHDA